MLYSWHVHVPDLVRCGGGMGGGGSSEWKDDGMGGMGMGDKIPPAHLVGVVELPLKNNTAVSMCVLNTSPGNLSIYIHTYTHIHTCTYIHVYILIHTHTGVNVCT
jgi:hypothetical protein